MAYGFRDTEYADDSVCLVCKGPMGKSEELICSATCDDIYSLGLRQVYDLEVNCD